MDAELSLSQMVAAEIRASLATRGILKKDLAEPLGIIPDHAYRKVGGRVPFTLNELGIVAAELGVQPWELFPGAPKTPRHAA